MAVLTFTVFLYFLKKTELEHAIAITFTSLVVIQWFNGFQSITIQPFFKDILKSLTLNPYIYVGVSIGVILQLLATYVFPELFHTKPLTLYDWSVVLIVSLIFFFVIEVKKWVELLYSYKKAN